MSNPHPSIPARLELPARAASGIVLGSAAVAAVAGGEVLFSILVAAGAIAALQEWHRLVNGGQFAWEMIVSSLATVVALWLAIVELRLFPPIAIIGLGVLGVAATAAFLRKPLRWPIPWHAFGAAYVGVPAIVLVLMRTEPRGVAMIGGLFVAVWSADTGALLFGRLIGGPKLAPILSPNKTWAGFVGGTLAAGIAESVYGWLLGGTVIMAFGLGIFIAITGHCGDLFESWVKRQFRAKNTGRLIPGHGGILDRIDSMLFAAPACAALMSLTGLRFFGGPA